MDMNVQTSAVTATDVTEALANSSLLVAFHQSTWTGEASDKDAVDTVKKQSGAKGDVGNFRKKLLANNSGALDKVKKAISAALRDHYNLTSPWGNTKYRLLPNAGLMEYGKAMQTHKNTIAVAVEELRVALPDAIEKAIVDLEGLADRSQYPSVEQIVSRFSIEIDFEPMTGGKGFPGLPKAIADGLQARLDAQIAIRMKDAIDDLWAQIKVLLTRFGNQTRPDGKIYDATVEEVLDLPDRIRRFNVMGDARLEAIASIVGSDLRYDVKSLKVDATRAWVHARVNQIIAGLPQ